ncbi:hypothetical protein H5410_062695, partial [Solanum commersonii]
MKSLKTENEADSNMKSTIRYTFVAPGAIGKGRGRGLKSLGEKGSLPSKSLLPQSSDLVKKYIKEIETRYFVFFSVQGIAKSLFVLRRNIFSNFLYFVLEEKIQNVNHFRRKGLNLLIFNHFQLLALQNIVLKYWLYDLFFPGSIGKGQGQGHKNSTMSTSQGIRMMHKNSMAPEKENMQINTSSPITNQVKKYTQEVETSKIFFKMLLFVLRRNIFSNILYFVLEEKIQNVNHFRRKGLNLLIFNHFHLLALQNTVLKYWLYDLFFPGSIGKGQGQGHKNSTMSTSQGIRMMHKNSMAPEKENMQINTSSHITNQVKKYTQEVETMSPCVIGKGQEKRTRSSSFSLGISEYEVGSFNKSADFDNQHMETPSKCTKLSSNMFSNHEIQKMKKIVLEKEDMQTNVTLPPSVDQVMNNSKIIE